MINMRAGTHRLWSGELACGRLGPGGCRVWGSGIHSLNSNDSGGCTGRYSIQ